MADIKVPARNEATPKTAMEAALLNAAHESHTNFVTALRFDGKSGRYSAVQGEHADDIPLGTKLAVNMADVRRGYICWKGGQPVGEVLINMDTQLPAEDQLEDLGPYDEKKREGWKFQWAVPLRDLTTGKQFMFKTSSASGVREMGKFFHNCFLEYSTHPTDQWTPIVSLEAEDFRAGPNKDKNYKPVFEIVEWKKTPEVITQQKADATAALLKPAPLLPSSRLIADDRKIIDAEAVDVDPDAADDLTLALPEQGARA